MKIRLARASKFNPFTIPGLLFAVEGEAGGGTTDDSTADQTSAGGTDAGGEEPDPKDADDALGDKGKQAIERMKAERAASRAEAKALREENAALKAKAEGKEAEYVAAQASQKVRDEALAAADARILKAEVRAVAAGKLTDPADALKFLDLSEFEVGKDGEVDGRAVAAAVDKLISRKPYLAVQDGKRFKSGADGGTRKESQKSFDEQIAAAHAAGDFTKVIALTEAQHELASKS